MKIKFKEFFLIKKVTKIYYRSNENQRRIKNCIYIFYLILNKKGANS